MPTCRREGLPKNAAQPHSTHAMRRARFELSAGGSVVCVDFRSVAGLVDAVLAADPARLTTLFHVIWLNHYKLETRTVLRIAVACRDPLAGLDALCKDALQTFADLDKVANARQPWSYLSSVVTHGNLRANALLHACDDRIESFSGAQRLPYEAIRQRLSDAAAREREERADEIRIQAQLRQARCPNLWPLFEQWRDTE